MAEDRNQFQSIYGDAEDEFEIEDVSDETLTIPTEEIRAVREEEISEEAAAEEEQADARPDETPASDVPEEDAPADEQPSENDVPESAPLEDEERYPEGEVEPYSDEEMEDITFGDTDIVSDRETVRYEDGNDRPDDREDDEPEADKVSILSYIGHAILFTIPVIGTILMLVYIISDRKNPHLRHLAQIWLVTLLLIAVGLVVAAYMFGVA